MAGLVQHQLPMPMARPLRIQEGSRESLRTFYSSSRHDGSLDRLCGPVRSGSVFCLPVRHFPALDYPVIQVQVSFPGPTPETMANNVATPLERQFMQIPGLELVTSNNGQGYSSFVLQFDLSKSLDGAATDVQAAITRAQGHLPADLPSPPTFTKTNPNDQPIQYIALVSDTVTEGQLYDYANTQVGERL